MDLINAIGTSIVAFIFVLGVMIFIHELGHYMVAKYLGIRVDVFSLGFGPRLFGFRRGETDYRISLLPLGGYVRMAGEHHDDNLKGDPDEFLSRPKSHRFAVAVAGPLMNIGLALALLTTQYMIGVEVPAYRSQPPVVEQVQRGLPADQAGIQIGDRIVSINGRVTDKWEIAEILIGTSPDQELHLQIERDGQILHKTLTAAVSPTMHVGTIGVGARIPYSIGQIEPGSPADLAGLKPGDGLLRISHEGQSAFGDGIPDFIAGRKDRPLLFEVERNGELLEKTIVPVEIDGRARVGFAIGPDFSKIPTRTEKYGLFEAMGRSVERTYQITVLTFEILGKLVTGNASIKAMSGPIEIAKYSGVAASAGLVSLIGFMALVSLQLGIFNLLPIPILDGGLIALLAIEGIIRRDLSLKVKERIFQVGFIFLILLMGVVIFNDLAKNLPIP